MADRIIPRHDTMARWAEVNPILMEGEWGIVTDSPSLYKVGDGLTAWNDLPFRGYDGTIVQNEGNSTRSVMSQNAVSTRLASANADITKLQTDVAVRYTKQEVDAKDNKLREDVDAEYAKKDGAYPKLTAGFAQEIVGDGSATEEEFSFRPTAGEDRNVANTTYYEGECNGVARIEKVKGNSVVWNQQLKSLLSPNNTQGSTTTNGITFTKLPNGWMRISGSNTASSSALSNNNNPNIKLLANHKYLINVIGCKKSVITSYSADTPVSFESSESGIISVSSDANTYFRAKVAAGVSDVNEDVFCGISDLTKMFGAGNEPTTVEEFWARIPEGVDIYAYNEGEIVDGNYGGVQTVGFNAFNGTYAKVCGGCPYYLGGNYTSLGFATEEGGTTEAITLPTSTESVGTTPSDRLYTPSQNGYIYAEGENININLSWDTEYGYLNGTYQPYKPFTRDLSWISKYFPNGMRSAGTIRDEIRFNSTTQKWEAVQNVGVTTIGDMVWTISGTFYSETLKDIAKQSPNGNSVGCLLCSAYHTYSFYGVSGKHINKIIGVSPNSGTIRVYDSMYSDVASFKAANENTVLNYALATPIITEIDEIPNMDFDVSDYGTEELIVAEEVQSAPIVADIAYAPNALSTIKQVPDILKRLKALESAVAQQTTTTTNEEETAE